jgi:hypothetical protein
MKFKAYDLIHRAVDEGTTFGVNRAYKHTATPTREIIIISVTTEVMNVLCDVLDFEQIMED